MLFSGFFAADGVPSWTLTKEGREFFSSPPTGSANSTMTLKAAIAKNLKPGGVFTDARRVSDEIQRSGPVGGAAHPLPAGRTSSRSPPAARVIPIATDFDNDSAQVEIDVEAGRVRLRPGGAR